MFCELETDNADCITIIYQYP